MRNWDEASLRTLLGIRLYLLSKNSILCNYAIENERDLVSLVGRAELQCMYAYGVAGEVGLENRPSTILFLV